VLIGIRGAARLMVDEAVRSGLPAVAAFFFEDPAPAGDFLRTLLADGDAVLFKGSRGTQVETALERFLPNVLLASLRTALSACHPLPAVQLHQFALPWPA